VPAAAVIPAPIAYIKVVAVKKLVVGFLAGVTVPGLIVCAMCYSEPSSRRTCMPLTWCVWYPRRLL
jgi:hypothetical protein